VEFDCPVVDATRLEQVLRHHFGATEVRVAVRAVTSDKLLSGPPRWEPNPGTGAHTMLEIVRERGVVRWRDIKHVRNSRAALELLLMDGHLVRVSHGLFRDGSRPLDAEIAVKQREPYFRGQLGTRQQTIYDALAKPATAAELRQREGVSRQAVDQILKKLMKSGLIRRLPTPGESSEWVYAQSGKRTLDVLVDREPKIGSLEKATLRLIPPVGGARRAALVERLGQSTHSALKRLVAKGLVEKAGTPKRQLIRLTQKGLTHSAYDLEGEHLPGNDVSAALKPEQVRLLLALDALGPARALDISAAAGVRSKRAPSAGQYLQRLRMSGYIVQERPMPGRAPIYRLTKQGTTAIAAAKLAGKAMSPNKARRAVERDAADRAQQAASRHYSSPGQGRTPEILALLESGPLTSREIQDQLSNPFKFYRSVGLAASDLQKRGWVRCIGSGDHAAKRWELTSAGLDWLEARRAQHEVQQIDLAPSEAHHP